MESKWPFMLITFGLLFALGLTISQLERTNIMKNWAENRCDFPIVTLGMFFKPEDDPRSTNEFAKENFSFCMKSVVDKFMEVLMAPINTIFETQVNVAGSSVSMLNIIRSVTAKMYEVFSKMMEQYFKKFNSSVYEMSRIVQYLNMAMTRLNAVVMSFLYTGITMFRGMINTIKFIIKVCLIMTGIMLAIIIILFFILFPLIPFILAVLGMIIYNIVIVNNVIGETSGGTIATAQTHKDGICFSKDTQIITKNGLVSISDIKIGDELGDNLNDYGKVTAVIVMSGKNVKLFNLHGVYVSGSHVVKEDVWKCVSDSSAIQTDVESDILYCLNTTSRIIPVHSNKTILFRDWEEIADEDKNGQYMWNYLILTKLNNSSHYSKWKDGLSIFETPFMNVKVKTSNGFVDISTIRVLDKVLDRNGNEQDVIGIVTGRITGKNANEWHTELYEYDEYDKVWKRGKSTIIPGTDSMEGRTLITETGEFIILDGKEKVVRDFTDIGHRSIHETYPFVLSRLNMV